MVKKLLYIISFLFCLSAYAQEQQEDSLVVLMSSKSAQFVDIEGSSYRKVIGPARFLHNNTYLLCDTAYWNVDSRYIDAWGNVSIIQEETVLTSDKLTYLVDEDLAQFRGSLVQLQDKDRNILRTKYLDYNTKDSVAVFSRGGAMRDKDGQIIESREGVYDSKIKKFTFDLNVNMFTDSIFIRTNNLIYESDLNLATFGRNTYAWKDENMLSADAGWYDRGVEQFFFTQNVHVMSEDQEAWCDSLYFNRNTNIVEMLGHVQVTDTTRNVFALAGRIEYIDSLSKVTLTREPAVISEMEEEDGTLDTVYVGAEKLVYYTIKKCDIQPSVLNNSEARIKALAIDPVGEFRKKAAEAAAKAAEEEAKKDPNQQAKQAAQQAAKQAAQQGTQQSKQSPGGPLPKMGHKAAKLPKAGAAPLDTSDIARIPVPSDSISVSDTLNMPDSLALRDSLAVSDSLAVADSLAGPKDTTKIGFLEALKNVRVFKKNMQIVCDSLVYTDLDSLARFYLEPIVWQDAVRQYSADSIMVMLRNGRMEKASLMSEAFVTMQEDTTHYNQIRGAEMTAYFNDKGGLNRFDALGGASALFYLEEEDALVTVNKTDSKMLSAVFKEGELERIYYYDAPKNDAFPVVHMEDEERLMRGFRWVPEKRPADRSAVTELSLRPSERKKFSRVPQPFYTFTNQYFPGYIDDIRRQIAVRDSLRLISEAEAVSTKDTLALTPAVDSLAADVPPEVVASVKDQEVPAAQVHESVAESKPSRPSSESRAASESIVQKQDSVAHDPVTKDAVTPDVVAQDAVVQEPVPVKKEKVDKKALRAAAKAKREAEKVEKQKAREARWAEKDKRDEEKAKAKEEKKKEKERARKRKALNGIAKQAEKDAETLRRYKEKYEKLKAAEKASGKAKKRAD